MLLLQDKTNHTTINIKRIPTAKPSVNIAIRELPRVLQLYTRPIHLMIPT